MSKPHRPEFHAFAAIFPEIGSAIMGSGPTREAALEQARNGLGSDEVQRTDALLVYAHAYAGGATCGHYSGGSHLILTRPLEAGRLKRGVGDALCKPHVKFWGLEPYIERDPSTATCKKCRGIAARLGLLPSANEHG